MEYVEEACAPHPSIIYMTQHSMARKEKTREYEHLAYFLILSGGYKMTENQDRSFCAVSLV